MTPTLFANNATLGYFQNKSIHIDPILKHFSAKLNTFKVGSKNVSVSIAIFPVKVLGFHITHPFKLYEGFWFFIEA